MKKSVFKLLSSLALTTALATSLLYSPLSVKMAFAEGAITQTDMSANSGDTPTEIASVVSVHLSGPSSTRINTNFNVDRSE